MKHFSLAFNLFSMALLHLVCCGLPLIISLGGSLGLYFAIKEYTNTVLVIHLLTTVVMIYFLYRPKPLRGKSLNIQRALFWCITFVTLGTYFFTHSSWFKTEEEIIRQKQFERIFKPKSK